MSSTETPTTVEIIHALADKSGHVDWLQTASEKLERPWCLRDSDRADEDNGGIIGFGYATRGDARRDAIERGHTVLPSSWTPPKTSPTEKLYVVVDHRAIPIDEATPDELHQAAQDLRAEAEALTTQAADHDELADFCDTIATNRVQQ
jgi:hypothetical protein